MSQLLTQPEFTNLQESVPKLISVIPKSGRQPGKSAL
jgi:hypothetical protein